MDVPGLRKTIHKFELPVLAKPGAFELELPRGACVVDFGEDIGSRLCVWAWVSPGEAERQKREFILAWTGTHLEGDFGYHGRAVHGGLIWHLLEAVSPGVLFGAMMSGCDNRYGKLLP